MDEQGKQSVDPSQHERFARMSDEPPPRLMVEIVGLIAHNKKWWLVPLFIALTLVGTIIFLGSTPAAPFIYTLF